eukprot:COSAG06_NODE_38692_length_420_cov_3.819315_1_plen_41_part_00
MRAAVDAAQMRRLDDETAEQAAELTAVKAGAGLDNWVSPR